MNKSTCLRGAFMAWALSIVMSAQAYPDKPIRLVIPYPPGGTSDMVGRAFGMELAKVLGQPVVVENKGGAAGSIGTEYVAKSAPDGYTLGMSSLAPFAINPACNKNVPYDSTKDFRAITEIASSPHAILVNKAFPARDFAEFLSVIKANPGQFTYGTAGTCGTGHMLGAQFTYFTKTSLVHVPYRGAGPAAVEVIGGHIAILVDGLPSTMTHIKSGALRPLVIAAAKRNPALPDVPTFGEVGLGEINEPSWYGLVAPAGTPDDVVQTLYAASVKALQSPDLVQVLHAAGAEPGGTSRDEHAAQIARALERMRMIVKAQNIRPE